MEGVGANCACLRDHFAVIALGEEVETTVLCWGLNSVNGILYQRVGSLFVVPYGLIITLISIVRNDEVAEAIVGGIRLWDK